MSSTAFDTVFAVVILQLHASRFSVVCLILLLFANFSQNFHRTALDRACSVLFTMFTGVQYVLVIADRMHFYLLLN